MLQETAILLDNDSAVLLNHSKKAAMTCRKKKDYQLIKGILNCAYMIYIIHFKNKNYHSIMPCFQSKKVVVNLEVKFVSIDSFIIYNTLIK